MDERELKVQEHLSAARAAARELMRGAAVQKHIDGEVARITLHDELGHYGENPNVYDLDDQTRDRLIVHARQDAAHALTTALSTADKINKIANRLSALILGCTLLILLAIWFF
ncbi:MAG: hypothetical protein ACTHLC_20560 [Rhizobiaceae bacterium]|jgi:hypothetical protein